MPKPLLKKLYLNGGKVTRVSDQGLTPRRSPLVKAGFHFRLLFELYKYILENLPKQENRLLKRIHLNNGKVMRISDQGLSPLVKNSVRFPNSGFTLGWCAPRIDLIILDRHLVIINLKTYLSFIRKDLVQKRNIFTSCKF